MPKHLLNRCLPNSVREFRSASLQRYTDGISLASAGRRTAAVYLWGYSAEMTLKAAYFSFLGFTDSQTITIQDLIDAKRKAISWRLPWQGNLHDLTAWANLIVETRMRTSGSAYASPKFGLEVQARGQRLTRFWKETLRYNKNVAYAYEIRQVREAVEWLLIHSLDL